MTRRKRELVYLVHIWLVEEGGKPAWRASLESTHASERKGFASLDDLFAYLLAQLQEYPEETDTGNRFSDIEP
jgi:hypothetical protein